VTPKGRGRDPDIFGAEHIENAWRYNVDAWLNGAPYTGNGIAYGESNCHVTDDVTGQGRDPNIFRDRIYGLPLRGHSQGPP